MQRAIVLAFLLGLSVGASGTACSAGYKHKAKLTGLTCDAAKTDAASCNTNCCELNDKTCGGLAASIACDANSYKDSDVWAANKATQATKDAWLNKAASSKNMNTVCCTARPTCASSLYSCPAGKKKASGPPTTKCTSDAKSCAATVGCCVADTTKCGGLTPAVVQTDCTLTNTLLGTGDAFKNTAATTGNKATNCCAQRSTCGSKFYSCPAGQKRRTTAGIATTRCTGVDAATCATVTCCEPNTNTCEGLGSITCAADKYYPDSLKNAAATAANKATNCCAVKATCAVATCPAGWKAKVSAAGLSCPKDAASCVAATCCEKDVTKCGGLTAVSCATGFYDENQVWPVKTKQATKDAWANKPATDATKGTACCTAKAVCAAPATTAAPGVAVVTTTPAAAAAAVVTTTPAAPALKFSDHKVAIEKGSDHPWTTNMALLGVGGLIGMSVLMAAQGLRSRMQAAPTEMKADAREVDNLLLDNENVE